MRLRSLLALAPVNPVFSASRSFAAGNDKIGPDHLTQPGPTGT